MSDASAYYIAVLTTILRRSSGLTSSVSDRIHKAIHVRIDGVSFAIRPRTVDLAMAALTVDPTEITRRFRPERGAIVIDVGANIGGYALRAALIAERVIAVEPEASNFVRLVGNIQLNGATNVVPIQAAISDSSGYGLLHIAHDSGRHSLEEDSWGTDTGQNAQVPLRTLDEIVMSEHLNHINWLKIDVERHELAVLSGARRALSITQNLILEFELSKLAAIKTILSAHGLHIVWYEPHARNSVLIARHQAQPTTT
jgi:FkbM family methyltransferase